MDTFSTDLGRKEAERFIKSELIDYQPFIAISDLYMVRKTHPLDYESMKNTVSKLDSELWTEIDNSVSTMADENGVRFNPDDYALGFCEGVAAVWEKIRDDVLS